MPHQRRAGSRPERWNTGMACMTVRPVFPLTRLSRNATIAAVNDGESDDWECLKGSER